MLQRSEVSSFEARLNRERRESGPVLDSVQPLFLERERKVAVDEQRRRGVAVESIEAQDVHLHA